LDGYNVALFGQVMRPTLKTDAEHVVKKIEGVECIANRIEVLSFSANDDRLRMGVCRAVYGHSALNCYALGTNPPIHIIIKNGNIAQEGVVANKNGDASLGETRERPTLRCGLG
jgi:hyperosmotically inducible periplasmic protein